MDKREFLKTSVRCLQALSSKAHRPSDNMRQPDKLGWEL